MAADHEVAALGEIVTAFDRFEFEAQLRMLRFLCQRYKDKQAAHMIEAKPPSERKVEPIERETIEAKFAEALAMGNDGDYGGGWADCIAWLRKELGL